MVSKQLVLHKIGFNLMNDRQHADSLVQAYSELNRTAGDQSEISLQYLMLARKLKYNDRLLEALDILDKAVVCSQNETCIILEAESLIRDIARDAEALAIESLLDLRIGPLYENFLRRGNVSFNFHAYAALHYQSIGDLEKFDSIVAKIKQIAPNFHLFKKVAKDE